MIQYQLTNPVFVNGTHYTEGLTFTFDGTYVQIGLTEPILGFTDAKGGIHIYVTADCAQSMPLQYTVDPSPSLVGATILAVEGMTEGSETVKILTTMGLLTMHHINSCCEQVELVDVNGDPEGLVDGTIAVFECRVGTPNKGKAPLGQTWSKLSPKERLGWRTYTFYTIRTTKGDVDLRWGEPNDRDDNRYGERITLTLVAS